MVWVYECVYVWVVFYVFILYCCKLKNQGPPWKWDVTSQGAILWINKINKNKISVFVNTTPDSYRQLHLKVKTECGNQLERRASEGWNSVNISSTRYIFERWTLVTQSRLVPAYFSDLFLDVILGLLCILECGVFPAPHLWRMNVLHGSSTEMFLF